MTAPVVRASTAPAISTGAVTSPASTVGGTTAVNSDLVVFLVWTQGAISTSITHTLQAGFFQWHSHAHDDGTTDGRLSVAVRRATVSGAQSYTPYVVAGGTANQTCVGCVVLQAGTWDPALETVVPPARASLTDTSNAVPNPPSVASLTGDYLVMAIGAWHVTTAGATAATAPANYAIATQNASASHVTHVAVATRTLTGLSSATEDPAAFGDNVTPNGTVAATIAVRGPSTLTSGVLNADGGGGAVVAAATRTTFSGALNAAGASAATVAAATRVTASSASADGAGGATVAASLRVATGSATADGAGAATVATTTRTTFSGALNASGASGASASGAREVSGGPVSVDGAGSVAVVASLRVATGSANADGVGGTTVAAATRATASSATADGVGVATVIVSLRVATGSANADGVGGATVAVATRATFSNAAVDGVGGASAVGTRVVLSGTLGADGQSGATADGQATRPGEEHFSGEVSATGDGAALVAASTVSVPVDQTPAHGAVSISWNFVR